MHLEILPLSIYLFFFQEKVIPGGGLIPNEIRIGVKTPVLGAGA